MTRADRETLIKIARQRERVAKTEAKERAARLLADFERQLDTRYSYDQNEIWEKAAEIAIGSVENANKEIAAECERMGIPSQFAPKLSLGWNDRGRNGSKQERLEMRRVAAREVEAIEQAARSAIERKSVETQERIMVGGLTSDHARLFLEAMPTVETLMPALTIERVKTLLIGGSKP
ncbi:MAG TPA: hypothetical protein VGN98_17230 [Tianweitania sediminis]|nr:hypothetical protein [Tianweitania sediminis]